MRHAPFHHINRRGDARLTTRTRRSRGVRLPLRARQSAAGARAEYARGAHSRRAVPASRSRSVQSHHAAAAGAIRCRIRTTFARRSARSASVRTCQLVAYDQGNGAYAARLLVAGALDRPAQRRGARRRHRGLARGGPAARDARVARPCHASCRGRLADGAWLDSATVNELRRRPGNLLVDARGAERFAGRNETIDPIAGHVPGARNHPFTGNLAADGKFLPAAGTAAALDDAARLAASRPR